jgi:very-short-patch-repair endonuclease
VSADLTLEAQDPRRSETAEDVFARQCRELRLPPVDRQVLFAKEIGRLWRFDFAFRDYWLAVEIEGLAVQRLAGVLVVRGRHASVTGIREDMQKYNTAALLGWTVLRFEQNMVRPKEAIETTMRVLAARGWKCEP